MKHLLALTALVPFFLSACNNNDATPTDNNTAAAMPATPALSFSLVRTLPHDTAFFTEGLEFYKNTLVETTGMKGRSKLVQKSFPGLKTLKEVSLSDAYFGEGVTVFRDTVYQLTWQEHKVFVYDKNFNKLKELPLQTEGWGLTHDDKQLILSDGSSNLYFYQPGTFRLLRTQGITEGGMPVVNINELEWVNGFVYANQWQYNYILKIDPNNGTVVAKMDLTEIYNQVKARFPFADVLNGIAYHPETKKLYVTGKYWPELLELQVAL